MREFGGEVVGAQGLTMTQLIPFLGGPRKSDGVWGPREMVIFVQVSAAQQPARAAARESSSGPCPSDTQLAQGGRGEGLSGEVGWVGCLPLVLPLVLVPGLLSKAQQPIWS